MDAIEKAIRNAFEKGNADDRAFREKVYRQAFAALDRAMQAHPNMTVEVAIARRKNLQSKIAEIETEFLPAVPVRAPHPALKPPPPASDFRRGPAPGPFIPQPGAAAAPRPAPLPPRPAPRVAPVGAPGPQPRRAERIASADPVLEAIDLGQERASLQAAGPDYGLDEVAPDRNEARASRRRRPFAAIFVVVTILAALVLGGWWANQVGLFKTATDIFAGNPPTTDSEDFTPPENNDAAPPRPGGADAARNWIPVFTPDDPSLVNAPSGTTAEVKQDDSGSFLRISSGASGAAIIFDVGQGILQQIAGRKAVFDILARAQEGKETQISVSCDFGDLGDCGRKRYALNYDRGEFLFDADLPDVSPGASGSIAVTPDITGGGNSVDIYAIQVSVSD